MKAIMPASVTSLFCAHHPSFITMSLVLCSTSAAADRNTTFSAMHILP